MKHKPASPDPFEKNRAMHMSGMMTIKEAMEETGASLDFIKRHCQRGSFLACKPLSNCGGWRIFREPFRRWWSDRIGATSNRPARPVKPKTMKAEA